MQSSDGTADRPADEEPEEESLDFGESYTWDDGITVTVGKPDKFKPSRYAAADKAEAYLKFKVTVVNKSKESLDLGLTYVSVQSANKEADQVFDSKNDLEGSPSTKLLKGRESEWEIGFGVVDPKDAVMEFALQDNFERPSLLYSS